jgi:beta-barrel assembly-enhancing protease
MRSLVSILVLTALVLIVSCATTGPGGKQSLVIIPTSQEISIGKGMADQVAGSEKRFADEQWQAYVNEVGQKIVKVCDRQDIEYHFTVIESDQINAFAAPGGYVYFYTGLLRLMDNEAEMAAVMSHEISHVVARHGIKQLQASLGVALATKLVLGDKSSDVLNAAINAGMGLLFAGYSRDYEREADKFGIYYMPKAGYDPNAAVSMFNKLAAASGAGSGSAFEQLLASHPETQERIDNAKSEIQGLGALPKNLSLSSSRYQTLKKRLPAPAKPAGGK